MSALSAARAGIKPRTVKHDLRPLAASAKVWRGGLAMCITSGANAGYFTEANTTDVGIVVGFFEEDVDNTGGANGALKANVDHFTERFLNGFDNDTGTPITVAMREGTAYLVDDHTVGGAVNGTPVGNIYDVSADGKIVWVEGGEPPPEALQVPNIQSGTSTLVSGTKTITGLTLTANSRIFITMKDPGAGALTTFIDFDVPAGTRTSSQFVVNAIDTSKAVLTTAVCTFDWMVIG